MKTTHTIVFLTLIAGLLSGCKSDVKPDPEWSTLPSHEKSVPLKPSFS